MYQGAVLFLTMRVQEQTCWVQNCLHSSTEATCGLLGFNKSPVERSLTCFALLLKRAALPLTDEDYYEDDEEDDPDALKDPLYQIDLQVMLWNEGFFFHFNQVMPGAVLPHYMYNL